MSYGCLGASWRDGATGVSEHFFHIGFLGDKAHFLIEFHGRGVTAPDVEGEVIAALGFGEGDGGLVEGFADVPAAERLIDAEVVDVEGLYIGEDGVILVLLKDSEAIAFYTAILVDRDEDRAAIVTEHSEKLLSRILRADLEDIGAAVMVDEADLTE